MNRLVINEMYKVFSKKGIYVLGFITLCMIVINTIICKLNNIDNISEILLMEFSNINIFIIISTVMISGSIVSDEYNKGTIKYLLIKPYKRYKILLSKLLCSIIIFILSNVFYFICCYICYGFLNKFNYDISIMKDILINVLYMLPEYLIILFFSLFISTIVSNNGSSIISGIGLFIGSSIINDLIISNSIKYLYWFPTICWDLRNGINSISFNIVVCIVTVLILMIITFIIFNNKEIRNA